MWFLPSGDYLVNTRMITSYALNKAEGLFSGFTLYSLLLRLLTAKSFLLFPPQRSITLITLSPLTLVVLSIHI